MTTTSGWCSLTAATACFPSPTDATTSMSCCRPRSSSSASQNTLLSSTSRTRIGAATCRRLFRRQEEWVVRLATLLDVHLELGVRGVEALQQGIELRLFLARQQRQHPAGLGQQAIGHSRGHLV